jgi:hypothetical protein
MQTQNESNLRFFKFGSRQGPVNLDASEIATGFQIQITAIYRRG